MAGLRRCGCAQLGLTICKGDNEGMYKELQISRDLHFRIAKLLPRRGPPQKQVLSYSVALGFLNTLVAAACLEVGTAPGVRSGRTGGATTAGGSPRR